MPADTATETVTIDRDAVLDLLPKLEEEARERQGHRSDLDGTSVQDRTEVQRSDEKAAAMVGVGRSSVAAANVLMGREVDAPPVIQKLAAALAEGGEDDG